MPRIKREIDVLFPAATAGQPLYGDTEVVQDRSFHRSRLFILPGEPFVRNRARTVSMRSLFLRGSLGPRTGGRGGGERP